MLHLFMVKRYLLAFPPGLAFTVQRTMAANVQQIRCVFSVGWRENKETNQIKLIFTPASLIFLQISHSYLTMVM